MDATKRWGKTTVVVIAVFAAVHAAVATLCALAAFGPRAASAVLPLIQASRVVSPCAQIVATVAFLIWVHAAHASALRLEKGFLVRSPGDAVWSYFIPIISLVRPIGNMYDLARASDPSDLPTFPELTPMEPAGYRDPAMREKMREPFRALVPITVWWIAWYAGAVIVLTMEFVGATTIGKAVLMNVIVLAQIVPWALLVRGITASQLERYRRINAREERGQKAP